MDNLHSEFAQAADAPRKTPKAMLGEKIINLAMPEILPENLQESNWAKDFTGLALLMFSNFAVRAVENAGTKKKIEVLANAVGDAIIS